MNAYVQLLYSLTHQTCIISFLERKQERRLLIVIIQGLGLITVVTVINVSANMFSSEVTMTISSAAAATNTCIYSSGVDSDQPLSSH